MELALSTDARADDVDAFAQEAPLNPPVRATSASRSISLDPGLQRLHRGHVMLDSTLIRRLRQSRLMSQQELADDCWNRNIPLSLTTIKRAELGHAVRFRIAREFARCFAVPVMELVRVGEGFAPGLAVPH